MDHAARHRAALRRFAARLADALGEVPPDIAESALGRTVLAQALVGEAVGLLAADADGPTARRLAAALVRAAAARDGTTPPG